MSRQRRTIARRSFLTGASGAAGLLFGASWATADPSGSAVKRYQNSDFYDAGGKFLVDKAREAYFDMFRRFHSPVSDNILKNMWAVDFGLGDFAHVGMAGMIWTNRQDYSYFGHEIYLLPGQMIPEHAHVETPKGAAKMESWHPRHGMIYTFGEGAATPEYLGQDPCQPARVGPFEVLQAAGGGRVGRPQPPHCLALHGRRTRGGSGDRVRHLPRHGRPAVLQPQGQAVVGQRSS